MTILVTGATGQVGGHVVDPLIRRGADVRDAGEATCSMSMPCARPYASERAREGIGSFPRERLTA